MTRMTVWYWMNRIAATAAVLASAACVDGEALLSPESNSPGLQSGSASAANVFDPSLFGRLPGRLFAGTNNSVEGMNGAPAGTGSLLRIDPVTGQASVVSLTPTRVVSLAYSSHHGKLYGSLASQLTIIDPETGATTPVGVVRDRSNPSLTFTITSMDFYGTTLYGLTSAGALLAIDPQSGLADRLGAYSAVGSTAGGAVMGSSLFLLGSRPTTGAILYAVDVDTRALRTVGVTGLEHGSIGLSTGPSGNDLLAVVASRLYSIDPYSGAPALIGETGYQSLSSLAYVDDLTYACPCSYNAKGARWRTHDAYVTCTVGVANKLRNQSLITGGQAAYIKNVAAQSTCGMTQ